MFISYEYNSKETYRFSLRHVISLTLKGRRETRREALIIDSIKVSRAKVVKKTALISTSLCSLQYDLFENELSEQEDAALGKMSLLFPFAFN